MKRCTVVIPDAGPINSLWVANRLDLLILLDIPSAKEIIDEMTHPSNPDKRKSRRKFTDLPDGIDDAAAIGSTWVPEQDEPPPNGKVGGCSR